MGLTATFSAGPTYTSPVNLAVAGAYVADWDPSAPRFDFDFIEAPGISGVADKYGGYRGQEITLRVCYVGSVEDIVSQVINDGMRMAGPSDLTLNGFVFKACFIKSFKKVTKLQNCSVPDMAYQYFDLTVDSRRIEE